MKLKIEILLDIDSKSLELTQKEIIETILENTKNDYENYLQQVKIEKC